MTVPVASSQETLKRRQAIWVFIFLAGVTAVTTGMFLVMHRDLVEYREGERALALADFPAAAAHLQEARTLGYRNPQVRLHLARALMETNRRDEALPLYLEALAAAPRDEALLDTAAGIYQSKGQPEKGLALYEHGGTAEWSVRSLARLGDLQQQAGHYDAAITAYRLAARRAPREPELQLRAGMVLAWMGRRTEAIESLRAAVALDPTLRLAQLYLARVLLWDGRFADAVTEYRRVLPP